MQLAGRIERDLGGGRDVGEVAVPRADLVEAGADARRSPIHDREPRLGRGRPLAGTRVVIGPSEQVARGDVRGAPCRRGRRRDLPSVASTSGISAAGSALAIEPPTVPRLRVGAWPTQGSGCGEQRQLCRDQRGALDLDLPRRRADHDAAARVADAASARRCARCRSAGTAGRAASPSSAPASGRPRSGARPDRPPAARRPRRACVGREYSNGAGFMARGRLEGWSCLGRPCRLNASTSS